jgi:exodeoxyribonuclease V alpha subunit
LTVESFTELSGTIERVLFKSAENGFTVFLLKIPAQEPIVIKGYTGQLHQGSQVVVKGTWGMHPKFGKQLNAVECIAHQPTTRDGVLKYLSSGLIKGIGPSFAERLVNAFGEKTLDIIESEPNRLLSVEGVGPKRLESIVIAWQDQKEVARVMLFLRSKDVSPAYAAKIYKTYGNSAIEKMQENPYRLVDDIWGVGFKTADQIALKLGLERFSLPRIKAGLRHVIAQATEGGHLYSEIQSLKVQATEILELTEEHAPLLKQGLHELFAADKIKLVSYEEKHYVSLPQFYYAEKGIAQKITRLKGYPHACHAIDAKSLYDQLRAPGQPGIELNEDQQRGILACFKNKVSIITGGPGTGKTTLVKKLLQLFEQEQIRFKLAAPTGRAAKRMFESTGKNAETLHRLLEFTPGNVGFARNEQNALDLDVLVVDEASMLDVFLMHSVLKALPWHASLVLIGDIDQLPSVGAGNVLHDLIASDTVSVTRLTQIFRQAEDSMIVVNAHRVNKGEFPLPPQPGSKRDFVFVKEDLPENIFPLLKTFYTQRLPKLGIHPDDTVVLVPMNKGIAGTQRINHELQQILNPPTDPNKELSHFSTVYRLGDRVMQIRNNYDKFVFNGDIGTITAIDKIEQRIMITFGQAEHQYDFSELNEIVLSYAISIHKSQGSEFKVVIIPIFMQHFILLQRNLIYTAITRSKNYCVLIGQPRAIAMGIKNDKSVERITFLKQYLTTDLEAR